MKAKSHILLLFISYSLSCYGQYTHKDSAKLAIIDTLKEKMIPRNLNEDFNNDTIISCSMRCLAVDKKIAESRFIYIYLVSAYFNKKQYDSAYKYGNLFLNQRIKKWKDDDYGYLSHYRRGRDFQLNTSDIMYQIDTARHDYKHAARNLITHNPEKWWSGSYTNFHNRMKRYYTNIMNCYIILGNKAKAKKYKRKLEEW